MSTLDNNIFIRFTDRASKFHEEHLKQAINSNQLHQLLANSITFQSRDLPKSSMSYDEINNMCWKFLLPATTISSRAVDLNSCANKNNGFTAWTRLPCLCFHFPELLMRKRVKKELSTINKYFSFPRVVDIPAFHHTKQTFVDFRAEHAPRHAIWKWKNFYRFLWHTFLPKFFPQFSENSPPSSLNESFSCLKKFSLVKLCDQKLLKVSAL